MSGRRWKYRRIKISTELMEMLTAYAAAENITIAVAINQFIRDGLEGA
jgi:hypothetical protein